MTSSRYLWTALLLHLAARVVDGHGAHQPTNSTAPIMNPLDPWLEPSYSQLGSHTTSIYAHIGFMIFAWFFILPAGVMLSLARSRAALPFQLLFLAANAAGVLSGIYYNASTPDLYPNNSHHKIGWIATATVTAQVAMSLLFVVSGRESRAASQPEFIPLARDLHWQRGSPGREQAEIRWSRDSGHGTERGSSLQSRAASPTEASPLAREDEYRPEAENSGEDEVFVKSAPRSRTIFLHNFIQQHVQNRLSQRVLRGLGLFYDVIDRVILILGFVALTTGGVTYAGIFRGNNVFNGLAHFIKGGIFFWYGILTLGRWMGCFAEFGWAWNVGFERSSLGRIEVPTAEFIESFVIFLYGVSNIFLEHLAAWGGAWSASDLEHVSISIMFFGGGLCGMLIESSFVKACLSWSISRPQLGRGEPQATRRTSMNPMPALIILLLGIMMSSHHQDSMVSSAVHKQWGMLLVGFSLARALTYILFFIAPPNSIYPSRPPTELIASFCLISGGLVFMVSTKDIVHLMEEHNLMAMFAFTVCMGFTAYLMAYIISVVALKGWASQPRFGQR